MNFLSEPLLGGMAVTGLPLPRFIVDELPALRLDCELIVLVLLRPANRSSKEISLCLDVAD